MWWRAVLVFSLAIINNISAQDDNNATETQTTLCCPCPPGVTGVPVDAAASTLAPGAVAVARGADGVDGVDDCPCRARDADSEGAASLFFPNAVRSFGNVMRPDPKEESKPLLHPEVGLASSVLETLREATDEEYRDALERDATRTAVDVASLADLIDGTPEEARNVVTVIVSPRDMDDSDAIPEASHVQETRCIHSLLGNSKNSLSYRTPSKGLEDILNLPLPSGMLHRQRDSGFAASDVHESVVTADDNLNTLLPGLKLKVKPNLLSLDPKTITENINNILSGANSESNEMENADTRDSLSGQISSEVFEVNNDILMENNFNRQSDRQNDLDCNTSPSINQETIADKSAKYTGPLQSLLFGRNNDEKPGLSFPLKNLLKLRDVELIPLDVLNNKPKTKINIPSLKLHPLQKTEARQPVKLTTKPSKITTVLNKLNKSKSANIQIIPKRKPVATDILDAVPSPSDDNCVRLKPETNKSVGVDMEQLEDSLLDSSTETGEIGNERADDLIAKSTDIITSNSAEVVQLKSSEIFQDEEVDDSEDFHIIDDTQTLESESDTQIISQEDISDVAPGSVDLSEINEAEDRSNSVPVILHPLKSLEEIRRSVVEELEALQKSNINALDSIKHNVEEISPLGDSAETRNQGSEENIDQISNVESTFISPTSGNPIEEGLQDKSASAEAVSFQDLQNMSDSILMASENHEQRAQEQNEEILESKEDDTVSQEANESDIDNILGMDGKETKNDLNQNIDDSTKTDKLLCPSDLLKISKQAELEESNSINNVNTENDLETLASDPIMDILRPTSLSSRPIINILRPNSKSLVEHLNDFGTKLRQSIVQPAPLINPNDFNIFSTPSFNLPDLSALNTNIPTLDDIRTRVSEILDGLARTANDDDGSSELDSDDFASDVNPVQSASPSSSNPVSIFSPLKPLEDINLDIIQLKPLPSLLGSSSQTTDLPGLNLNRYKAKLAVPKSLDLKPLNLASTLGNNGGLVGTTLTIGPQKKKKTGTTQVKSHKNAQFVSSRGALNNNPTLADITSTMHKNALNLLNIPKNPNLQASNTVGNLAERIKSHAEDTVKSIHESMSPSALAEVHNNVLKNANNLLASGRKNLQNTLQTPSQIDSVVENLKSQTQNRIQHLHNTLNSPRAASDVLKNTNSILKSPKSSLDAAVDNLKAQSVHTFNNVKQTLDTSRLADLSESIHKGTQNILKSSAAINPTRNVLGSTMQAVPSIDEVTSNLRSHTQSTLRNIQQTLNTPTISDISTSIQKSAQQVLNSPITNNRPQMLKSTLQPTTSIDTVVDNLRSQTQNTMKTIQNSLNAPTLSDISTTVQKHAQNLLNSPVASTGRDAFKQVLQASSPINLTPHAEQVAKDLQRTLKATLRNSPIKDLPPLPHPNDVIQTLTDHHADINDKIYALHTDLNDRLESIHNEITDPARLRSILSPPGNMNFELFAIPLPMSSRSISVPKQERLILQAKQPVLASQRKQPKTASTVTKPRTENAKPNSMRGSKGSSPSKSFRMSSTASLPTQTRIERPTLSLTSKKSIKGLQELKKPVLPKLKPLTKNKVTITFGSTTQRPSLVGKSKGSPTTAKPKVSANKRFKPKPLVRQPTPWHGKGEVRTAPKRLGEPLTSPSKTAPTLRTPVKAKSAKPISKPIKIGTSRLSPESKLKPQSTSKPILKTTPRTLGRASAPSQLGLNKPKSPLLTKLTDALKSKPLSKLSQTPRARTEEMAPSASERFEKVVALEEPMKENVPYKCKMMCVKVDLNEE
ncbi:uncharacterized protein LOC133529137 [Cydia pomonella]|uniref:uncharacterized protein LOC133529137 n=1 Tax=Cydia pomonella TaxID=82600 RepID=UPI002ADE30AD|nr:uncharacterized protein LOC133529137 [Cydia pomonella]